MILRPKARNQILFLVLVHKEKQDSSSRAKHLALNLWWTLTNKILGTQYHHKIILYSSCHVLRRVLGGATKVKPEKIRVGGERLIVITGSLIATTVTQRALRCDYRWYLFLFHWIIQSSIHLSCLRFVNSHPGLHLTVLVITNALIAITLTQRAMSCRHQWYLRFPHGMIHWLIQLNCPRFVNSHPDLHLTQRMSCKLLQYPVGLLLIRQIPCHRRPQIMEVAIFMDAWLMCLSWHRHNDNNMP